MKTILVVEDEPKIREVVVSYMKQAGFQVHEADSGKEAWTLFMQQEIDLVILDLMLPDGSGEEVCTRIRRQSPVPVLMLTAKASAASRVQGLSLGADDYVVKPFDPAELTARVRAILRRSGGGELLTDRVAFGGGALVVDALAHKVTVEAQEVELTPNEYKLLVVLARHPGRTFTRDELTWKVMGFDFEGDSRTIDQHVKNLRHKIEKEPKRPRYIETVYGSGYRFNGGA